MPEGFPEVLRSYSKELLRDKPQDIYNFSYEYFLNKLEERQVKAEQDAEEKDATSSAS